MAAQDGDFAAMLAEHARLIAKVASVYARTAEDRRDLAQDIATQLWRAYPAFDASRAKLSTWLYRIALNVAISHLRRASSPVRRFEPLDDEAAVAAPAADASDGDPDARVAALYAVIDTLAPLDRALVLLYLEAKPYAEIADVLGISVTNVATKLGRLKPVLRAGIVRAEGGSR